MRLAKNEDIKQILEVIDSAKKQLKEQNIDQWQYGYPNENRIFEDISLGKGYVKVLDNVVVAYIFIDFDGDKDYEEIIGEWKSDKNSAVLHRIAVLDSCKGKNISSDVFEFAKKLVKNKGVNSIRVDTHEDNKKMQYVLEKNGYKKRGIVFVSGAKRLAFDIMI